MHYIFIILIFLSGVGRGSTDEWLIRRLGDLEAAKTLPLNERLDTLGRAARAAYPYIQGGVSENQRRLSREAVSQIIEIPSHAEYFGNKITDSYDGIKQGYAEGKREIGEAVGWSRHLKESQYAFKTLAMIPSPETVRVLGEMLLDDWKWPDYDDPKMREMVRSTLGVRALSAMSKLPIANPPTKKLQAAEEFEENIGAWKQWYQEIKDGRRTFRFKGDPVHYDLRGPSKRGALEPNTSRSGKRTAEGANQTVIQPSDETRFPGLVIVYVLAGLFLVAGFFVYRRKREVGRGI